MANFYIIGAGNLGWHLSQVLDRAGHTVTVISRRPLRWPVPVDGFEKLGEDAGAGQFIGAVFLAVPDDAIPAVSRRLSEILPAETPVIHTSGATPVSRIDSYFDLRGALWPIRSLRRGEPVAEWTALPLVYDGNTPPLRAFLGDLCGELSNLTYRLDDEQRARLHLAAVFSNNFVTWQYEIAHQLTTGAGIPFETLLPIIRDTAGKQDGSSPALRQTGAAARRDTATMRRHLELLADTPAYAELYKRMSALIMDGLKD